MENQKKSDKCEKCSVQVKDSNNDLKWSPDENKWLCETCWEEEYGDDWYWNSPEFACEMYEQEVESEDDLMWCEEKGEMICDDCWGEFYEEKYHDMDEDEIEAHINNARGKRP